MKTRILSNSTDILAWGDNLADLFFLQIQGSGRLLLPDSQVMQIGYAANNGHPYTAIGRILLERGLHCKRRPLDADNTELVVGEPQ